MIEELSINVFKKQQQSKRDSMYTCGTLRKRDERGVRGGDSTSRKGEKPSEKVEEDIIASSEHGVYLKIGSSLRFTR